MTPCCDPRATWPRIRHDHDTAQLAAGLADSYTLERALSRGGMATIHLARDVRHAREVAIKALHPQLTTRGSRPRQ